MMHVYMLRCSIANTTLVFYTTVMFAFVCSSFSFSNLKEITNVGFEAINANVDCMFYKGKNATSVKNVIIFHSYSASHQLDRMVVFYECLRIKKKDMIV